jgi:hypothetical protein
LSSAVEAATLILSVDETVRNPQSDQVRSRKLRGGRIANDCF